ISAFLSGVSFLCLAIKISSWIEFILTPIQEACFLLYGVYTEFVILSIPGLPVSLHVDGLTFIIWRP
ncbi:hypothetical protein, partial [Synergistes jonesii]|uniref:hypothetical protein n=1 Tax=Synergistes jonesii TaxID=2754 RepID=UPI0033168F74